MVFPMGPVLCPLLRCLDSISGVSGLRVLRSQMEHTQEAAGSRGGQLPSGLIWGCEN